MGDISVVISIFPSKYVSYRKQISPPPMGVSLYKVKSVIALLPVQASIMSVIKSLLLTTKTVDPARVGCGRSSQTRLSAAAWFTKHHIRFLSIYAILLRCILYGSSTSKSDDYSDRIPCVKNTSIRLNGEPVLPLHIPDSDGTHMVYDI